MTLVAWTIVYGFDRTAKCVSFGATTSVLIIVHSKTSEFMALSVYGKAILLNGTVKRALFGDPETTAEGKLRP